ncbi:transposase domain-containing protein [Brevundimonas sp.]|uniref:transposase domain-containing protein n=1 Tax=Brevundimonas sp. TaxID=1871086 RepID=UPI003F7186C3
MTDAMGGMGAAGAPKVWFTAAELAELRLPGLSSAKRKINERALAEGWALRTDAAGVPLHRTRAGRGGRATEYHIGVLPPSASTELVKRGISGLRVSIPANDDGGRVDADKARLWSWFDQQAEPVKAEAARRLAILTGVEALEQTGLTRTAAVATMAARHDLGAATVWEWARLIAGVEQRDRLPVLAPQRKGGGKEAVVDDEAWRFLLSDYLRPERPTFASCYHRCLREFCGPRGLELPHQKTLQRKLEREVPAAVITLKRHGADALRNTLPPQQRSVAGLHAMELVNIDGHKADVFVRWPDGKIARPILVAIQDIFSRKILSWRVAETEDQVITRLVFADLFKDWGIPKGCLLDNGRAFASKMITGGAKTRYRFGIRPDDPTGLLTALDVNAHWALPYRGQSKPIERAWRDLCDNVAKHPAFSGAYVGNKPDAKPENYGERAIDLDVFKQVLKLGIEAHNDRPNRQTEMARGRLSLNDVFNASYATAVIGKATPEQLRMALLASAVVNTDRKNGSVKTLGNIWWSPDMSALAGRKVILRYDPDDLSAPVHVYGLDSRYLATAELQGRTAFLDQAAAKTRARQEANLKKATKAQAAALQLLTAAELAAMMPDAPDHEDEAPRPTVIRPVRARGNALLKPAPAVAVAPEPTPETEDVTDKWARAMERASSHLRVVE